MLAEMESFLMPVLGFWHTFKTVSNWIWRQFAPTFIAPLFHRLHPRSKFWPMSTKLVTQTFFFTIIRLAYPSFRKDLQEAIQSTPRRTHAFTHLVNMKAMVCDCINQVSR
jgi:hypothetical protein